MKSPSKKIHLSIPVVSRPSFARPLSPGCPTDTGIPTYYNQTDSTPPWFSSSISTAHALPMTATALTRESSWNSMVSPSTMVQTPHDSVSKGSTPRSQWRIRPGSYIAFSLDVRSIAEKFTAGSPAYEEVMQMQSKKYVGLVVSSYTYSLDDDSREDDVIEELVVNFVGNSPPSEEGLIKHSMPIAPSTYSSLSPPGPLTTSPRNVSDTQSPLPQSPLQTTTLFPWKNRVQWTTSGTRIIVRKFHESKLNFYLDDEEFERFEQKVLEDYATIPTFHTSSCATQTCSEGNMPDSVMDVDGIECNGKGRHRIEKLKVPPFALPAQVWRDIREANERDNPALFLDEVDEMDILLSLLCQETMEDTDMGS